MGRLATENFGRVFCVLGQVFVCLVMCSCVWSCARGSFKVGFLSKVYIFRRIIHGVCLMASQKLGCVHIWLLYVNIVRELLLCLSGCIF